MYYGCFSFYSHKHVVFSAVSCWRPSLSAQGWNLGVWLRTRSMVRKLYMLQFKTNLIFTYSLLFSLCFCWLFSLSDRVAQWNAPHMFWTALCLCVITGLVSFNHIFSLTPRRLFSMTGEVPPSLSGACGCSLDGLMYVFGGCDRIGQTNQVRLSDHTVAPFNSWHMAHSVILNLIHFAISFSLFKVNCTEQQRWHRKCSQKCYFLRIFFSCQKWTPLNFSLFQNALKSVRK